MAQEIIGEFGLGIQAVRLNDRLFFNLTFENRGVPEEAIITQLRTYVKKLTQAYEAEFGGS